VPGDIARVLAVAKCRFARGFAPLLSRISGLLELDRPAAIMAPAGRRALLRLLRLRSRIVRLFPPLRSIPAPFHDSKVAGRCAIPVPAHPGFMKARLREDTTPRDGRASALERTGIQAGLCRWALGRSTSKKSARSSFRRRSGPPGSTPARRGCQFCGTRRDRPRSRSPRRCRSRRSCGPHGEASRRCPS